MNIQNGLIVGVIIIGILGISLIIYMMIRNNQIYKMRSGVNQEIRDLPDVKDALKIYKNFESVTYNEMMSLKKMFIPVSQLEIEWKEEMGFYK